MLNDNARGALFMTGAMAAFVINDALMKLVSAELPLLQAIFLRGVFTTALFLLIARHMGVLRHLPGRRDRILIALRSLAEAGSTYFFLSALFHMPLANVTAILQALPLTITLAGALFLREAVGWRRLMAIAVGFVGVLLIVRPDTTGFDQYALMALVAVVLVTARDLLTRGMSRSVPSLMPALAASVAVTLFAAIGSVSVEWAIPSPGAGAALGGAGLLLIAGYLLGIMAMRVGELAMVSPFRYTGLVWALVLGYTLFGDWPDTLTLAGAALIVATGLFTFYREHRLSRARARAAQSMPR